MPRYSVAVVSDFTVNSTYPPGLGAHDNNPDSAVLADGDFIVVYDSPAYMAPYGIGVQRYNADGTPDGAPQRFLTIGTRPSVIGLDDGGYIIAGQKSDGIYYQRFDASNALVGSATVVSAPPSGSDINPQLTALNDGGWAIVWQRAGGTSDIYLRTYNAAGVAGPETLVSSSGGDPVVTTLANGDVAILWDHDASGSDELRLWRNGVVTLVSNDDGRITQKSVALLPDGRLVAVWTSDTGVHGAFVATDGTASPSFDIDTGTGFPFGQPDIAVFPDGRFVVVWTSSPANTGGSTVLGQVFESDGSPVAGTSFEHAMQELQSASVPLSVVVTSATDFVVSYAHYGNPSTLRGIHFELVLGVTFNGTPGPDNFAGTEGGDDAYGLGGDDILTGLGGDDLLDGGTGNDQMTGGFGDDVYYRDSALDVIVEHVGQGTDTVYTTISYVLGSESIEFVYAADPGATTALDITGNSGNQTITGNAGNNALHGGGGTDVLVGLGGNDTYYTDVATLQIVEAVGGGNDRLYTSVSFTLGSGSEVELLSVNSYSVTSAISLTGNEFSQTIIGNNGLNSLTDGGGSDLLIGLGGDDHYYIYSATSQVQEAVGGGGTDVVHAFVNYVLTAGAEIEVLYGMSASGMTLTGNLFNQSIFGTNGNDVLHGGGGVDLLAGLGGNDIYYTDVAGTQVQEIAGGGFDQLYSSVSYVLGAGVEVELLSTNNTAGTGALNLTGNAFNQTLLGNEGVNLLHGGGGVDVLIGYGGNDIYFTDVAATQPVEAMGGGFDQLYTSVSYVLGSGEIELLSTNNTTGTAAINLTGNNFGQMLLGNDGVNLLHGGGGVDTLVGYGGNDIYYTDVAATQVVEAAGGGNDQLYTSVSYVLGAGSEVELLSVNDASATAAINLTGNGSSQLVLGNAGANVLDGKGGADTLAGYGGADTFAFTSALGGGNVDVIADFVSGTDKIALDDAIFTGLTPGALAAGAFVNGTTALDADDRILYNSATGQIYFDADGNAGGAAVLFATVSAGTILTASDFTVI